MDFVTRLKQYIDYTGLAVSQFADTAQIPRPTLSQILNGRNKKISNELIAKLHEGFPKLNILWMLFGDGNMEVSGNVAGDVISPENRVFPAESDSDDLQAQEFEDYAYYGPSTGLFSSGQNREGGSGEYPSQESAYSRAQTQSKPRTDIPRTDSYRQPERRTTAPAGASQTVDLNPTMSLNPDSSKRVQSIMVFYTDNSFEIFTPSPMK